MKLCHQNNLMEYKYEVIKKAKNNQEATIKKSGVTVEFTMAQVADHYKNLGKVKKELEAKISYEQAKLLNIIEHNPIVSQITDEKERLAIFMAVECEALIKKAQDDLDSYVKAIQEYSSELFEIEKQTGISMKEKE